MLAHCLFSVQLRSPERLATALMLVLHVFWSQDLAEAGLQLFDIEKRGGRLGLGGNPWIMPPEGVVEKGSKAVQDYLEDVRTAEAVGAEVVSLHLLKVVLVGSSAAGKTSLMRSISQRRASPTEGPPEEASTVGVEFLSHQLNNTKVEFYDCAGQVDYAGMQQTFLSRRALYLLVWDVTKHHDRGVHDPHEVIHEDIMRWLYTLSMRAPRSTVMMVANKCDRSTNTFAETIERVEASVRDSLEEWYLPRGFDDGRAVERMNLLRKTSAVSCMDFLGIEKLRERISDQGATEIKLPPAWNLALKVVDALRDGHSPLQAARRHLKCASSKAEDGVMSTRRRKFITRMDLFSLWESTAADVGGEALEAGQRAAMINPKSALEGALWISNFAGHILSVDGGDKIFLNVEWLSEVLRPIMSHKLRAQVFPDDLSVMRDDLVNDGVLRWQFALHLWRAMLGDVPLASTPRIMEGLVAVLITLGVALPLQPMIPSADGGRDSARDMLVIMRLPETCSDEQRQRLVTESENTGPGVPTVTLKWRFDQAGPPYGLVERLIAACHALGVVDRELPCWRYGALFKSHAMNEDCRHIRLYTFIIRYDASNRTLTMSIAGSLDNDMVWAALRYVASAMVNLSRDWPGLLWEGWPDCAEHPKSRMFLASSTKAKIGDLLLPAAQNQHARRSGCDCQLKEGGVLALVLERLGKVVDTSKGLPSEEPEAAEKEGLALRRCREIFNVWLPYAWQTAVALWGHAVALFLGATVVGIAEEKIVLWRTSLAVAVLLAVGAVTASVFACRTVFRPTRL